MLDLPSFGTDDVKPMILASRYGRAEINRDLDRPNSFGKSGKWRFHDRRI